MADVGAGGHGAIRRCEKAYGVPKNGLHSGILKVGVGFVAGLKVEDLSIPAFIEASCTEGFTAAEVSDKEQFVGGGDDEGLAVSLFMFKDDTAIDPLHDRVSGLGDPKDLAVIRLTPGEVTGGAEESLEWLGMVGGVKEDGAHTFEDGVAHHGGDLIGDIPVLHVPPPDEDIGLGEDFFGDTAILVIQCGGADDDIVFGTEKVGDGLMDAVRVHLLGFAEGFLVIEFIPNKYADHREPPAYIRIGIVWLRFYVVGVIKKVYRIMGHLSRQQAYLFFANDMRYFAMFYTKKLKFIQKEMVSVRKIKKTS